MGKELVPLESAAMFVARLNSFGEQVSAAQIQAVVEQIRARAKMAQSVSRGSFLSPVETDYEDIMSARALLLSATVAANVLQGFDARAAEEALLEVGKVWDGNERISRIASMEELRGVLSTIPLPEQIILLRMHPLDAFRELSERSPYNR